MLLAIFNYKNKAIGARRPEDEVIKDHLHSTPPRTWRRRPGGQLKTWATAIKAELEPLSGHAQWRKDRVFNLIGEAGSTGINRPELQRKLLSEKGTSFQNLRVV